MTPLLSSNV